MFAKKGLEQTFFRIEKFCAVKVLDPPPSLLFLSSPPAACVYKRLWQEVNTQEKEFCSFLTLCSPPTSPHCEKVEEEERRRRHQALPPRVTQSARGVGDVEFAGPQKYSTSTLQ